MSSRFIEAPAEFRLIVTPAPDTPAPSTEEFKKAISEFAKALRAEGIEFYEPGRAFDGVAGSGGGLVSVFVLAVGAAGFLAKRLEGPLTTLLNGVFACKASLEFHENGKVKKATAQDSAGVEGIIKAAAEYHKRTSK